jgi:23S rRNA pseudouridine1911/1915/1917 synthase
MRVSAGPADAGKRLDQLVHEQLPQFSRSRIQEWIKGGRVVVNGQRQRPSHAVRPGDAIEVDPSEPAPSEAAAEPIPLSVLYEDADVVVVDKPAGMVVHAGAGVEAGTLANALVHRYGMLSTLGGGLRPGIVHRLDRYTSGALLVARNDAAHHQLAAQFASRKVEKVYIALVHGQVKGESGRIDRPIARDPIRRTRMTARLREGRPAWTEYRVLQRFTGFTLVEARIGTGRTHQIRVHLSSIGHPVVGDRLYGAPAKVPGLPTLGRYFLHARRIRFQHPVTGQEVTVESELPFELRKWMAKLE